MKKGFAYKVFSVTTLAAMLVTTTGFSEGSKNTQVPAPSVEDIVKQGQKIFIDNQNQKAEETADKLGYKDLKKQNPEKTYKSNEKLRIIVEVEQPTALKKSSQAKKAQFKQKQDQVISLISKKKSATKVKHRFHEGFNGFSMETEFRHIKDIQATPGVIDVHIARTFEPTMGTSKELVQAQKVWEQYGYKGEGLLVAIVDSGVDYTHKDMTLTEEGHQNKKWTEEGIREKLVETAVNEVWYSDKVPSGYDWADEDADVIPRGQYGSPHGMHVAGTVGANGDEASDGVQGIAPGVQLLAEKVFSDKGGGAYEDDIIAGIEHAVSLEADVINMSLGTDSGFVGEENDPIQKVIREATEQGTLVVVSGGNSAYSSKNSILPSSAKPYAENPDIGSVGEPSVSPYAISVASYENSKIQMNTLSEENGLQLPYQDQTQYNFKLSRVLSPGENYEMVYVGEGRTADFNGKDVTGKIVVAKPDQKYASYSYIQTEAKKNGAKAVILVPPNDEIDYPFVLFSPTFTPAATTSKVIGNTLIEKLSSGQIVNMQIAKTTLVENPDKDTMSDFSSFGSPHTLDFKPEISAPGGSIYSTIPNNEYELMSGTSMAAPHVAGGSALLLQALYEKGLSHSKQTALKAKIALMNTSQVVQDSRTQNKVPYSPRVQGAGIMKIQNALKTPAIVTSKNTPLEQAGAVALKEMKNKVHFNLDVEAFKNQSVKELEYTVYVDVLTDGTEMKKFDLDNDGKLDSKEYLTLTSERIQDASVTVNGKKVTHTNGETVKIKPGQKKNLNIQIRLPKSLKKGSFVEGYVRLVPTGKNSKEAVPLTVPYMGFYGDWTQSQNIDPTAWDKNAFLGYTALWNDEGATFPMGYDPTTGTFNMDRIVISPNAVLPGVFPTFTALRNLQKTEMYVENEKGKSIQYLGDFSEYTGKPWKFRKNIIANRDLSYGGYLWDVKNQDGEVVKDGKYNFVIKTTLDYKGAKPQEVKLPINVDSVAPTVSDIQVKPKSEQYEISFKANDNKNGSGYNGSIIWYNGEYQPLAPGDTSLIVDEEPKSVIVVAVDYAFNQGFTVWGDPSYIYEDMLVSYMSVYPNKNLNANTPAQINAFANNRLDWTIHIKDLNGKVVDTITAENEHEIHLEWTPKADIPNGTYTVSAVVKNKQGFTVTTSPKTVTVLHP